MALTRTKRFAAELKTPEGASYMWTMECSSRKQAFVICAGQNKGNSIVSFHDDEQMTDYERSAFDTNH